MELVNLVRPQDNVNRSRFIERVFKTFEWRSAPEDIWSRDHWEYEYYKKGFRSVLPPREFDVQAFNSHPFHSQGDRLCVMTVQGYLYYLPSFIVLLMENIDLTNDLGDALLGTLRSFPPFVGSIADWVAYARAQPTLEHSRKEYGKPIVISFIHRLEDWFIRKVEISQCERIASMTEHERKIVVQFLDIFLEEPEFVSSSSQVRSVQSILRNDSYSKRLGAENNANIEELTNLLDIATQKYPSHFPSHISDSIRGKLEQSSIDASRLL